MKFSKPDINPKLEALFLGVITTMCKIKVTILLNLKKHSKITVIGNAFHSLKVFIILVIRLM